MNEDGGTQAGANDQPALPSRARIRRERRRRRRRRRAGMALMVAGLAVVGVGGWFYLDDQSTVPVTPTVQSKTVERSTTTTTVPATTAPEPTVP